MLIALGILEKNSQWDLTEEKSKLLFYLKKMGIYWGRTYLALAKANSDPSLGFERHK